ncbi:SARP family transcriptional regulator [Virgisporangium aliadipatigenens]|uniref:SARP family transcriptional regulator n=1 Tax=Virgisporangium aliadipatigenens TaxID=741659 RepID=A0A8J3YFU9_9ACTN|nr:SARP family transcriptional regulator [Virgisporangium aliadipatigenens]
MLGAVRGHHGGAEVPLGSPQQRVILAMLLLRPGPVTVEHLIAGLWSTPPTRAAAGTVRTYLSRLRALLHRDDDTRLVSDGGMHELRRPPGSLDLDLVERDLADADAAEAAGDLDTARRLVARCARRWSGPVLTGLDGPFVTARRGSLTERHMAVVERRLRLDLDAGDTASVVAALATLTDEHPFRENLRELLMLALYRQGRTAEALEVFAATRSLLRDELGIDPGARLATLHRRVLDRDPTLAAPGPPPVAERGRPTVRPAQLPRAAAAFSGRRAELVELAELTAAADTTALVVIGGMGGLGKTTLAVRWAHAAAERYPDGQLFVDLRGFGPDGAALDPAEVLAEFLDALGVPDRHVPRGTPARAALFRSVLNGRRMLVLLDNARDGDQVRPLLPGAPGCAVVVTSRSRLRDLVVAEGATPIHLGPFSAEETRAYLRARLGGERVDAEPAAVAGIERLCGGSPLALAVVAGRALTDPAFPLAAVAAELAAEPGLSGFAVAGSGSDVRAAFSWSYRSLPAPAADLFRRLALHPGPHVALAGAVSLAGADRATTRALLRVLCDAHLLSEYAPERFRLHDLLRAYATELVLRDDDAAARERVTRRIVDHYRHSAVNASDVLQPTRRRLALEPPAEGVLPEAPQRYEAAVAWYDAEIDNLTALIEFCRRSGRLWAVLHLTWTLDLYRTEIRRRVAEWAERLGQALECARRLDADWWIGYLHSSRGRCTVMLGRPADARPDFEAALAVGRATDDPLRTALALHALSLTVIGSHRRPPTAEEATAVHPYAREALELYGRVDNHPNVAAVAASSRRLVGWYAFHHGGGYAAALPHFHAALDSGERSGNRHGLAATLLDLGRLHRAAGAFDEAVRAHRGALELYGERSDARIEALVELYVTHRDSGAHGHAIPLRTEALRLLAATRSPDADGYRRALDAAP